jgi:hypothetical protein
VKLIRNKLNENINNEETDYLLKRKSKILEKLHLEKGYESYNYRKAIMLSLVLWLPMLILTFIENTAYGSIIKIPFILDYVVYARFFVALPMLFYAQKTVQHQSNNTIKYFLDSGIISDNNVEDFQRKLKRILELRDSKLSRIILFVFAYVIVFIFWKSFDESYVESSWLISRKGVHALSYAGYWYFFVAAPMFHFVLYLMVWKYLLWAAFMWKISRMELNLYPTNPDLTAGLGFIGYSIVSFAFVGFAQSSVMSGEIANKIAYMGDNLSSNKLLIVASVAGLTLMYLFPAFFFINKLYLAKLKGILEYGVLTIKQSKAFHKKWLMEKYDEFLATGDFSALTDLNTSYDVIQKMRTVPVETRKIMTMALIIALPFAPLVLLAFPANEILEFVLKFFV